MSLIASLESTFPKTTFPLFGMIISKLGNSPPYPKNSVLYRAIFSISSTSIRSTIDFITKSVFFIAVSFFDDTPTFILIISSESFHFFLIFISSSHSFPFFNNSSIEVIFLDIFDPPILIIFC